MNNGLKGYPERAKFETPPGGTAGGMPQFWAYPTFWTSDATVAPALNEEVAVPLILYKRAAFDLVGLEVTTSAASAVFRLGLREDIGVTRTSHFYGAGNSGAGAPGYLLRDFGTIDASTTGHKTLPVGELVLEPAEYWLTVTLQGATGAQCRARGNSGNPYTAATGGNDNSQGGWRSNAVTGSLPMNYLFITSPVVALSTGGPKIALRACAIRGS